MPISTVFSFLKKSNKRNALTIKKIKFAMAVHDENVQKPKARQSHERSTNHRHGNWNWRKHFVLTITIIMIMEKIIII